MINTKILEELKKALGIKHTPNIYKQIDKIKRNYFIVDRETAAYCLAFKKGIRIEKYLTPQELQKVQSIQQNKSIVIETPKVQKQSAQEKPNRNESIQYNKISKTLEKIINAGKIFGIKNIDQSWIDSLVILNFIETASTKFLMDHDYSEDKVKTMKWDEKLTKLQNKIHEEAKISKVSVRTSIDTFFKNYRQVRNEQDHIAHLPTSHITKKELRLLQQYLDIFIETVFTEHKKYCLK